MNSRSILMMTANCVLGFIILISCTDSQKKLPPPPQQISVVRVIQQDVPIYRFYVGQIYGESDIPIRARVEGFLESINFEEGNIVKKGALLYTIDPQTLQSKVNAQLSQLAQAKTMAVKAKNELDRYKPLADISAVSKSDLDAAQAEYDAAVAAVEASQAILNSAKIDLSYTRINSPIDGIIGKTNAKVGEFVGKDPNPVILNTVSKLDYVKVKFFITESQLLYFTREYLASLETLDDVSRNDRDKLELILSDGSLYKHHGNIDFIDRGVDATTGSILVQASFPNPDLLLRPGMYAKVKIEQMVIKDALLVPQRCVSELQGDHSIFIVTDSNTVETRKITTGERMGDLWQVSDGLKAGEKVVIDGLQKVGPGLTINPVEIEFKSQSQQN